MKRINIGSIVLLIGLLIFTGFALASCSNTKANKSFHSFEKSPSKLIKEPPLKKPQSGEPIGKVCVVYSDKYHIQFLGFEKLHSYRQHYRDIYCSLRDDNLLARKNIYVPAELTRKQILSVHSQEFMDSLKNSRKVAQYLEAGFIAGFSPSFVDGVILRSFRINAGGTLLAARLALKNGIGINLGGGYHHAMPDHGEGFNIYADIAIAIKTLQKEGLIKRALIIDLDAHQGNGSAEIFAGDDTVFTFSMHEKDIYPIPKSKSDLDVEFPANAGDDVYLANLKKYLPQIFKKAKPDIVILQGGSDVLAGDPLTNFNMTHDGLVKRDAMVIDECVWRGIPVVTTLGGGYGKTAWQAQAASIANTIKKYGEK